MQLEPAANPTALPMLWHAEKNSERSGLGPVHYKYK